MTEPFIILHLSDTHIGNPKYKWDSQNVFKTLIEDIRKVSIEFDLQPQLLVFSGDLAFGQLSDSDLKTQYEKAHSFFETVLSIFSVKPKLFLVPGNHDINREMVDEAQKAYRETLDVPNVEKMMVDNTLTFRNLIKRQDEWKEFAKIEMEKGGFDFEEELNSFSGTAEYEGVKIGIVGLNSSWASFGDNEKGKLWIGKNQLEKAIERVESADFRIAVAHHPPNWLNEGEETWIREKLQSNFHVFLHGHEHSGWFVDSTNHLTVSGGACYERSDKPAGYSWLKIEFENKRAQLFLREYNDKGKGGWRANEISGKTDKNGRADILNLFSDGVLKNTAGKSPSTIHSAFLAHAPSVSDYIDQLDRHFRFVWEPPPASSNGRIRVFWAIRLRTPTPIHAVQSFVAAGLQKLGCDVFLWLDDLGKVDFSADTFFLKIDKWFAKAGGDSGKLVKRKINEFKESNEHLPQFWSLVQEWLGTNSTYYLDRVLEVSKLIEPNDSSIGQLSSRRPRRLLTPSMVWSGLALLFAEQPESTVITLGGFDEKNLWKAWKECVKNNDGITGHLYTPILQDEHEKPLHMDTINIGWDSRDDIRRALKDEFKSENWDHDNRLIPWCLNLVALLPREIVGSDPTLKIDGRDILSSSDLKGIEEKFLVDALTDEFTHWLVE